MAWDAALDDLLESSIVVTARAASTAPSLSGVPSFSTTATTCSARWVRIRKMITQNDGSVAESLSQAWIKSTGALHPTSKFALPDGSSPPVMAMESYPDSDGIHHSKIFFGG